MSSTSVKLRLPPIIKVYEAIGALGDERVRKVDDSIYYVSSSDGSKVYKVCIKENVVCSTDNGTVFKHYIGYPIISSFMLSGVLPRDRYAEKCLSGIRWRELNEGLKSYRLVLKEVFRITKERGCDNVRI